MGNSNIPLTRYTPLGVCYLNEESANHPIEKTYGNAGIDLYSNETVTLKKGEFALIPLGVIIKVYPGFFAALVPRSSTYKTWKVIQSNHIGIIDSSYCGPDDEWKYPVIAMEDTVIEKGSKICQALILPDHMVSIVDYDPQEAQNRGGFGSTGK